jgi:hypothetical protein
VWANARFAERHSPSVPIAARPRSAHQKISGGSIPSVYSSPTRSWFVPGGGRDATRIFRTKLSCCDHAYAGLGWRKPIANAARHASATFGVSFGKSAHASIANTMTCGLSAMPSARSAAVRPCRPWNSSTTAWAISPVMMMLNCPFWALPNSVGIPRSVESPNHSPAPPKECRDTSPASRQNPHASTKRLIARHAASATPSGKNASGDESTAACGK